MYLINECSFNAKTFDEFHLLAVPCNSPTNGEQAVSVDTALTFSFGDNYTYVCNDGYEYSGELVSACQSDGNWSLSPPTCTGKFSYLFLPFKLGIQSCKQLYHSR